MTSDFIALLRAISLRSCGQDAEKVLFFTYFVRTAMCLNTAEKISHVFKLRLFSSQQQRCRHIHSVFKCTSLTRSSST